MITKCKLSVLIAAALTVILAGMALADYHVDPVSGNNNNDGLSHDTAFKSGAKAWGVACAANAAQTPFTEVSVVRFWPGSNPAVTNSLGSGSLTPSLTNGIAIVGEGASPVPVTSASFSVGLNTEGPAELTFTNVALSSETGRTLTIGSSGNDNPASTGRVSLAGGSFIWKGPLSAGIAGYNSCASGELDLRDATGPVQLGPDESTSVGTIDLIVGNAPGANASVRGLIDLRTEIPVQVRYRGVSVANNANNAYGAILFGSNAAFLPIRMVNIGNAAADSCATGIVSVAGGGRCRIEINLTDGISIGCNASAASTGTAYGILDLGAVEDPITLEMSGDLTVGNNGASSYGILDAGASTNLTCAFLKRVYIGTGGTATNNYGRVTLGSGAGIAGGGAYEQYIGNGSPVAESNRGLLELNGMELAVTNRINISRSGAVRVRVDGKSAGLIFRDGTLASRMSVNALSLVADGGGYSIMFVAPPPEKKAVLDAGAADSVCWGFKWAGNHVSDVNTLIADGRMAYDTSALDATAATATGVFYDAATDATYVGFYTRERGPRGTVIRIM